MLVRVGQRDAGMPSGTSWLPLERVKEADVVLGDLRWLEGLRAVFSRARKERVPQDEAVGRVVASPDCSGSEQNPCSTSG